MRCIEKSVGNTMEVDRDMQGTETTSERPVSVTYIIDSSDRLSQLNHQESDLKREIAELETKTSELEKELNGDETDEKIAQLNSAIVAAEAKMLELRKELENLDDEELERRVDLAKQLVSIKKEKDRFKTQCRERKQQYEARLNDLKEKHFKLSSSNQSQKFLDNLIHQINHERAILEQLDLEAARTNQEVLQLRKQIDDVPSKSEINQYQRRFIELFQLVTTKNNEIKRLYTLYNELEDTRSLLAREVSLLESILDNLSAVTQSTQKKAQFIDQFQTIVDGILKIKHDVNQRLASEREKCDRLNMDYSKVIDCQHKYYKALREFRDQCIQNEALSSKKETIQ